MAITPAVERALKWLRAAEVAQAQQRSPENDHERFQIRAELESALAELPPADAGRLHSAYDELGKPGAPSIDARFGADGSAFLATADRARAFSYGEVARGFDPKSQRVSIDFLARRFGAEREPLRAELERISQLPSETERIDAQLALLERLPGVKDAIARFNDGTRLELPAHLRFVDSSGELRESLRARIGVDGGRLAIIVTSTARTRETLTHLSGLRPWLPDSDPRAVAWEKTSYDGANRTFALRSEAEAHSYDRVAWARARLEAYNPKETLATTFDELMRRLTVELDR